MRKVNKSQIADLSCDEQAEWPLSSEKVNSQLDALRQKMANGGTISSEDITGLYLILNPIVDDPKEHIGFKCEYAVPKSDSIKGETTIKLCDLNRDELVNNRRDAWIEFNDYDLKLSQLYKVLESMPDDSNILKDVVNLLEKRRQMLVELAFTSMFDNQVE